MAPFRHLISACFLILALAAGFGPSSALAQACTHHVNATDGDDGNDGSLTAPVRSIEFAFSTFPAGSVICVAAGEYFYGPDADGIQLVENGKSVQFRLESFAGASEIRFSEKEFVLDVGSGTVEVVAGSSDQWVLGSGIVNADDPGQPDLLNFLHTFQIASGTLALQGVTPALEASVGNPDFQHPQNGDKRPPETAAIRWGNGNVTGNVTFGNAPRTVFFEGSDAIERSHPVPFEAGPVRLVFDNANTVSFPSDIDLGTGVMTFASSGTVRFDGRVNVEASESGIALLPSWTGTTAFSSVLAVESSSDVVFIDQSGSGQLIIDQLEATSNASARGTILNQGPGSISIQGVLSDADPSIGSGHFLDVQSLSGTTTLGRSGSPFTLSGSLTNASDLVLAGETTLQSVSGGTILLNTGTISADEGLVLASDDFSATNDGVFSSGSFLTVSASGVLSGAGTWPATVVDNASATLAGSTQFPELSLSAATVTLGTNAAIDVAGRISASLSSSLLLETGATLSFNELSVDDVNTIIELADDSRLLVRESLNAPMAATLFTRSGGQISGGDDDGFTIAVSESSNVAPVLVSRGTATLSGGARWHELWATGADLSLTANEDVTVGGMLATGSASIDISASQVLLLNGTTLSDESSTITLESPFPIQLAGTLETSGGAIDFGTTPLRLTGASVLRAPADAPTVLPSLLLDDPGGFLTLEGAITVVSDLVLDQAGIFLDNGSRMALMGNLSRLSGSFALESEGTIVFSGSTPQQITGFGGSVLPSLVSAGSAVSISGSTTLFGSLRTASGAFTINDGSTLSISHDVTVSGGNLTLGGSASLRVSGDFNLSAGTFAAGSGTTTVQGNIIIAGGNLNSGNSTWLIDPDNSGDAPAQEAVIIVDADATLSRLALAPEANVRIEGGAQLTVDDQLTLNAGATLLLGNNDLAIQPGDALPTVLNNGAIDATSGRLLLQSSPTVEGPTLGGNGQYRNVTLDLDADDQSASMVAGTASLTISGELSFLTGALDMNGAAFVFDAGTTAAPGLHLNLSDANPSNGVVDARGLTDSTGDMDFNASDVAFDLRYSGNATTLYDPPALIAGSNIKDLTITTRDPVNTPALFGLSVSTPIQARGSFELASGSALRLQQPLTLTGDQQKHTISGRISGSGSLIARGAQNELRLEGSDSYVERLVLQGADAQSSTSLWFDGRAGEVSAQSGRYLVGGPISTERPALTVQRQITLQNTNWTLNTGISTGANAATNLVSIQASSVQLGANGFWQLPLGGQVTVDASSQLETINTNPPGAGSFNGAFVLKGSTRLNIQTVLPRLTVDIRSSTDDIFLESDLTISESLSLVNGDVRLGGYDLELLSGTHFLDADAAEANGSSDAILGDISQEPGSVMISGTQTLFLGSGISIQDALVTMDAGDGSVVGIRSLTGNHLTMNLSGGRLHLVSGELSLAGNDLMVASSSAGMVTAAGGRISGHYPEELSDHRLESLDDAEHGELVLIGSGNASVVLSANLPVDNVRVDGTVRVEGGSLQLIVGKRLVFGQRGASLLTEAAGNLAIAASGSVVRRGSGSLSHAPSIASSFHLAYQLGSGTLTGFDTGFSGGNLNAGLELPQGTRVTSLLAVPGSRAGSANSLRIPSSFAVAERLILVSGSTVLSGGSVSLDSEARILLHRLDPASPLSISLSNPVSAQGPYDLDIIHRGPRFDIPGTLQAAGNSLRTLSVAAAPSSASSDVVRFLGSFDADTVRVGATDLPVDVNLTGNTLRGREDVSIVAGDVTSSQLALIDANGTLRVGPDGQVSGNIDIQSGGNIEIEGQLASLGLSFEADARISGTIAPVTGLHARGEQQTVTFAEASTLGTLSLGQSGADPRLDIVFEEGPAQLEIASLLRLESGILSLGDGALLLPESAGVTRSTSSGVPSHVEGRIERSAQEGSTSDLLFPTGLEGVYMPLTLSFTSPLLSGTDLSVSLSQPAIVSQQGFPIVDQEAVIGSLAAPVWRINSSVDFARSQPYSVSASVPLDAVGSGVGIRILRQREGNGDTAWSLVPGTQLTAVTETGVTARAFGATGGLEPGGFWMGLGLSAEPSRSPFSLQFVDVTGNETDRVLRIGGTPILSLNAGQTATAKASFLASPELTSPTVYVIDRGEDTVLEGSGAFDSDDPLTLVAYPSSSGDSKTATFVTRDPGPLAFGMTGLILVNLLDDGNLITVGENGSSEFWATHRPAGSVMPTQTPSVRTAVSISVVGSSVEEVLDLDLAQLEGESALWLVHHQGASLGLTIVRADGTAIEPAIVTDKETPDETLPRRDAWQGNFPNPFSSSTTVRFTLSRSADVRMDVFDVLGRRVSGQEFGRMTAGAQSVRFDGSRLAGGAYFVRLSVNGERSQSILTGRVVLSR